MRKLLITTLDMLLLIEQSTDSTFQKIQNAWFIGKIQYTNIDASTVEDGIKLTFDGDDKVSFVLKGIKMNQLYKNR